MYLLWAGIPYDKVIEDPDFKWNRLWREAAVLVINDIRGISELKGEEE